ncbi:MAG: hypothetical protein KZQ59_09535, partial [Candidatus Thiodiazotropha sp. (ex Lucinoma aequizonata)]|nr:hypothetical protein [Candidatus Thiodiazotropha sp. (ex Lucinoma aequizonata)]
LTLNGKLDIRGPIQEGTDLVQGLNLLVVHSKSPWVTIMKQELPPFRLISRWNQVLRSDSFHIGQGL